MKKVFKITGIGLASLFLIIGMVLLYINSGGIPSYKVEKIEYQVHSSPESIARGQKLTMMLCATCHLNTETGKLSGKKMVDAPVEFGEVYSQNITQDKTVGIGNWTDGELVYLFRTGIKRDGHYAPPYMAKMPNMADEDINAIISFLHSDHAMVNADPTADVPCKPSLLTKILCRFVFKPFEMPKTAIPLPDSNDKLKLGKYLAVNLECFSCHSSDFKTNNYLVPTLSEGYFAGGNKPLDEQGRVMVTPNLTPDKETGIGNWSEEDFIRAVKYGLVKGQDALRYPMMPYAQLSDAEATALFAYLQSIAPIKNKVERSHYN
jgi:mono/diheme cytochrome c family protein